MAWRRTWTRSKGSGASGSSKKKNAFESLPQKFSTALPIPSLESNQKVITLFPKVLEVTSGIFDSQDLLTLRQVSRTWKEAVDNHLISGDRDAHRGIYVGDDHLPCVYLNSQEKVEAFQKSMSCFRQSLLGPIPFRVRVGIGMFRGDLRNIKALDEFLIKLYWDAVYKMVVQIGGRIPVIYFDIKVPDELNKSVAERTVKVIMNCLKQLSNVTCLGIKTTTDRMEALLSNHYKAHLNKGRAHSKKALPYLGKLKTLEMVILGGEGASFLTRRKYTNFPWRFLLNHGSTLKRLKLIGNLKALKTMGLLKAHNLETLSIEVHHCPCLGHSDKTGLDELPKMEVDKSKLKVVEVTLSWNWRARDVARILKWLGSNFPGEKGYELEEFSMESSGVDWEDDQDDYSISDDFSDSDSDIADYVDLPLFMRTEEELDGLDLYQRDIEENIRFFDFWNNDNRNNEREMDELIGRIVDAGVSRYMKKKQQAEERNRTGGDKRIGDKVKFSASIGKLKLPKVGKLILFSDYKGSWRWLSAFPKEAVRELHLSYYLEDPELAYQQGFLKDMLKDYDEKDEEMEAEIKDGLVWNYFPKMKFMVFVCFPENTLPCMWHITRSFYEDYLKEQAQGGESEREEGAKKDKKNIIDIYKRKEQVLKFFG